MNIGIRLHDTVPGSFWERMCRAKAQGFDCMQLALSKALPHFDMADAPRRLDEHLAIQMRGALMIEKMECAVLGCYLELADRDPERLEKTREIYRAHLKFAPKINARVVGTEASPAPGLGLDVRSEEALQCFIDGVRPLVKDAQAYGACLAIEPAAGSIIDTPERMERVLDALDSKHVRVILDAVHLLTRDNYMDADRIIDACIRRFGDRISVLHMRDYRVAEDQYRVKSVACGEGVMDYDKLLRFAIDNDLPMTLEDTTPENAETARRFLVKKAQALK